MSEEKRRILEMLEAGKITQEDAARLLDALGEDPVEWKNQQPAGEPEEKKTEQSSEQSKQTNAQGKTDWGAVLENLGAGVDKAVQEAIKAASPALESLGAEVDSAMKQAYQVIKDNTKGSVVWTWGDSGETPLNLEENEYQVPVNGPVKRLRIEWVNGPLELRTWDGETIRVVEYSSRPLADNEHMDVQEENGSLRIRWNREKNFRGKISLRKHLVVELPKDTVLEEVKVDNVTGGSYISGLRGNIMRLKTVSGSMECSNLQGEVLRVEGVSGSLLLRGVAARELRVSGTSGEASLEGFAAQQLRVETVSGGIMAVGNGEDLNLDTISGGITLRVDQFPKQARLHSVSGRLETILPEGETGFTVEYSSVSGGFFTEFPLTGEMGKRKGKAVYQQGGAKLRLDTVSGRIGLRKNVPQGN